MKIKGKTDENEENSKESICGKLLIIVLLLLSLSIGFIAQTTDKIGYYQTSNHSIDLALKIKEEDLGAYLLAKLNIFDATKLNTKRIIAPGTYGKYTLLIKNLTNKNLVYSIQLNEINMYNMNIKYKLKLENVCLSGKENEWKNAREVNVKKLTIAPHESTYYTIYWTWMGERDESKEETSKATEYILTVGLTAVQYKERN